MHNLLSFQQFKSEISKIVEEYRERSDIYYLSGSYELEKSYSLIAIYRWYEVYTFLAAIPEGSDMSILDIGVTPFTFFLKRNGFEKVEALDLSKVSASRCKLYKLPFYSGGLFTEDVDFNKKKYDFILFLEVIEHIHKNPIDILSRLSHLLNSNGGVYLTTPNLMVLSNRFKMLLNKKLDQLHYPPFQYNTEDHGPEHDRVYMPAELKEYCTRAPFSNYKLTYSIALEKYRFRHRRSFLKMLQLMGFAIKKIFPSTSSTIIIILTK